MQWVVALCLLPALEILPQLQELVWTFADNLAQKVKLSTAALYVLLVTGLPKVGILCSQNS